MPAASLPEMLHRACTVWRDTRASPELPRPLCSFGHVHPHLAHTALADLLALPSSLMQQGIPAHHGNGSDLCSLLGWDDVMEYAEKLVNDKLKILEHGGGKFSVHPF